ncbi:hypothetical protein CapIbe_000304 [Capra ibex]
MKPWEYKDLGHSGLSSCRWRSSSSPNHPGPQEEEVGSMQKGLSGLSDTVLRGSTLSETAHPGQAPWVFAS